MNTENTEILNEETTPSPKKKKRHPIFLLLLVLLLAAGGGFGFYYFSERNAAANAVRDYLESVQKMDFSGMESHLQSSDLSSLDVVDLRNATYTDFFQDINRQMSFQISGNRFNLQEGTATVTARIKYVDGTKIYQASVSEFLRQMVSTAFSEEALTSQEAHEKLASILKEKAAQTEYTFAEAEVSYPVIKAGSDWKIISLDEETVRIMSANFQSIAQELEKTVSGENNVNSIPVPSENDIISIETDKFSLCYTHHSVTKDFAGLPCLLVYYDYTNKGSVSSSAMVDISIQAFQNGKACEASIPEANDPAIDNFMREIQPGQKVSICQVFSLTDESDVTIKASETFHFGDGATGSQILKLN